MWNRPTLKQLEDLPKLYETTNVKPEDKIIHMHFWIFQSDWFIAEVDPKTGLLYGFVILNGDTENAEWGYIPLEDLIRINVKGFHHYLVNRPFIR